MLDDEILFLKHWERQNYLVFFSNVLPDNLKKRSSKTKCSHLFNKLYFLLDYLPIQMCPESIFASNLNFPKNIYINILEIYLSISYIKCLISIVV